MLTILWAAWAVLAMPVTPTRPVEPAATLSADNALTATVRDLCHKDVALLGEAAHGDGHTDAFKVALIERLVRQCHFNAVFFEASHYDFLAVARSLRQGKAVTPEMVSSAIGGLWKFDQEFQPLVPFLVKEANAHQLALGGLDGQLGAFESFYSNDAMPDELTAHLAADRRSTCREAFRRRIYGDYPADKPHAVPDRAELLQCVAEIAGAVHSLPAEDALTREEEQEMLVNIDRFVRTDLTDFKTLVRVRDHAMYLNFAWLARRLPPHSKIIVWGATAHMAKEAAADPSFAGIRNFGSYLHQDYGNRAFALGFSAYSGAYRYARKNNKALEVAPPTSIEAATKMVDDTDAVYLDRARLAQAGAVPAAPFSHEYRMAKWDDVLDGLVVFRAEFPPHSTRPGY